jgi:acetyl-CoA/propionyl-CoA carboxylase carboxyl transferase subunit
LRSEKSVVDAIVEPAETRTRIAEALVNAPAVRGAHVNIPL